jgi:hypothetical protein
MSGLSGAGPPPAGSLAVLFKDIRAITNQANLNAKRVRTAYLQIAHVEKRLGDPLLLGFSQLMR